jgi:hypothetical protein
VPAIIARGDDKKNVRLGIRLLAGTIPKQCVSLATTGSVPVLPVLREKKRRCRKHGALTGRTQRTTRTHLKHGTYTAQAIDAYGSMVVKGIIGQSLC